MAKIVWNKGWKTRRQMNGRIARMPGVQGELRMQANKMAAFAEVNLDSRPKHRTGKAQIIVERIRQDKYGRVDWFVTMWDPTNERWPHGNAVAIEFGHRMGHRSLGDGRPYIHGLYIMSDTYAAFAGG